MTLEAIGLALLGAFALWGLARTGAPVVSTAGFRLGYPPAVVFVVTAVVVIVAVPWPSSLLRRVAPAKAIAYTILFLVGEVYYDSWQLNAASTFLVAGLALAGFVESALLNSEAFDPNPNPCQ